MTLVVHFFQAVVPPSLSFSRVFHREIVEALLVTLGLFGSGLRLDRVLMGTITVSGGASSKQDAAADQQAERHQADENGAHRQPYGRVAVARAGGDREAGEDQHESETDEAEEADGLQPS